MTARFWGKTAVPHTIRQTDAIAFDFFLPRCGDSMAPGVKAVWGKEGCEGLYGGILRKIYNEALPQTPPKGLAPWGPHAGGLLIRP